MMGSNDYKLIYLEKGTIKLTLPSSDTLLANANVEGPKANKDNENYAA